MCKALSVSRSGYYDWCKRPQSQRQQDNQQIIELLRESHQQCEGMCGLDKMLDDVREKFPSCSRNRVYRLQKQENLYSVRKKKAFRVCTTDSKHNLPIAENLLQREFQVNIPNTVWVTDITQIETQKGTAYLAIVKDLHDKEIVGWSLANHMRTELCLNALSNAVKKRHPSAGLIHHSDRGSQYCSYAYQDALKQHKMIASMSRKGNCWDNACAETFFSTIKTERIHRHKYENMEALRRDLFWYIECFYNRKRRHAALGNLTIPAFQVLATSRRAV
jgi:putative transposase